MSKAIKSKVSKSLVSTVGEHLNVKEVHFDRHGRHYFNVHPFKHVPMKTKDKEKDAEINKKMNALNGNLYGRIRVINKIDDNGRAFQLLDPVDDTQIVESVDREDILAMDGESDLAHPSLAGLSDAELKAVQKMREKAKKD